jgi:6-pyruvoyltetrahydropterin/6-carboxytetrahydropterin synthase
MPYQVTKHYAHDVGLSACFRQPKARHSHCSKLHGYALGFTFVFESETLDERNWVIDFGGLKPLKKKLHDMFDHKTAVDVKDPEMEAFRVLHENNVIDLVVFDNGVGCERFARAVFDVANDLVRELNQQRQQEGINHYVRVVSVTCHEHGANSASFVNHNLKAPL